MMVAGGAGSQELRFFEGMGCQMLGGEATCESCQPRCSRSGVMQDPLTCSRTGQQDSCRAHAMMLMSACWFCSL